MGGAGCDLARVEVALYGEQGRGQVSGTGNFHRVFDVTDSIERAALTARPMSSRKLTAWRYPRWWVSEISFEGAPFDVEGVFTPAARVVAALRGQVDCRRGESVTC